MATSKVLENLAHMKFMIRANTKVEDVTVRDKRVDEEHWRLDVPDLPEIKSRFIKAGYSDCEGLGFGRHSFKSFNPVVEKLRRKFDSEDAEKVCAHNETVDTVTEEEMTQRYSSLIGTLGKKLKSKRDWAEKNATTKNSIPAKKAKFKKPKD